MVRNVLFVAAIAGALVTACGGETESPQPSGTNQQTPGAEPETPGGGTTTTVPDDKPADANDACSVVQPGAAKALPAGVSVPSAAGLKLTFELKDQRVALVSIRERGVTPAWTTKDTQIFAPDTTSGDWIETRDSKGELTFQGNIWDPLSRNIEAAPDPNDPNSTWKNSEVCSKTATFSVEVPGDAVEVRFYANEISSRPTKLMAWYRLR